MAGKGLGKGLKALMPDDFSFDTPNPTLQQNDPLVFELEIGKIRPNAEQPRKTFKEESLKELAESIQVHGILQPLVVKKEKKGYTIIAGERRFRAAQLAGFKTVPVILKDLEPKVVMEIALIENVQREDLNPMEEAMAYEKLTKEFGMTQKELGERLGKNRATISNTMRLLALPEFVREKVLENTLSAGHARALLSLETPDDMIALSKIIIKREMSVRETEAAVKKKINGAKSTEAQKEKDIYIKNTEARLVHHFMTKVSIKGTPEKGKIELKYQSREELNRVLDLLHLEEEK